MAMNHQSIDRLMRKGTVYSGKCPGLSIDVETVRKEIHKLRQKKTIKLLQNPSPTPSPDL
jgi:hypothetical protein